MRKMRCFRQATLVVCQEGAPYGIVFGLVWRACHRSRSRYVYEEGGCVNILEVNIGWLWFGHHAALV